MFVTGQDEEHHAGQPHGLDGLFDLVLEFVFDGGGASKFEVSLYFLVASCYCLFLLLADDGSGVHELLVPAVVLVIGEGFFAQHEGSESFDAETVDVLLGSLELGLAWAEHLFDGGICAFAEEFYSSGLGISYNNRHPLSVGVELKNTQFLILSNT